MDPARIIQDLKIEDKSAISGENSTSSATDVFSKIHQRFVAGDSVKENVLRSTAELINSGAACWLFPEYTEKLRIAYAELVRTFVKHAALPVCEEDSGTLPAREYEEIPDRARAVTVTLLALTSRLTEAVNDGYSSTAKSLVRTLGPTLCTFAITHLQEQPWTDEDSRKCALELLSSVVTATKSGSVMEMLCGDTEGDQRGMLHPILDTLQPELTKETWKRNQAMKHVFSWLLQQMERPWLTEYLEKVFPPSLLISDDYQTDNKVLGVQCLHHIVLNVPAADLRQFNRAQVLYHALFNHLYTTEAPLIEVVLPCLIDLLLVLEKPQAPTEVPRKPNRFDDVLRLVLTHMEMEHKLALRRIYASNLLLFIEKMGIRIVCHLKRLERVIVGYLEVSDGPEERARLSILEVLERTIQTAWPRMECRMGVLTKSLLRFLVDVSSESLAPNLREVLMSRASHCLFLLDQCTQGKLLVSLRDVDSSCAANSVLKCLQDLAAKQDVSDELL